MLFFFVGRFRELGELGVVVPACGVAPPQVVVPAVDGDPFAGAVLEIVLVPAFDDVSATVAPNGVSDDCLHRFSPLFDLKTGSLPPPRLEISPHLSLYNTTEGFVKHFPRAESGGRPAAAPP